MAARTVDVDLDVLGEFTDVVLAADGGRARRRDPRDELLLFRPAAPDRVRRRPRLAVALAQSLCCHQSAVRVAMHDVRVASVSHGPVEFVLFYM